MDMILEWILTAWPHQSVNHDFDMEIECNRNWMWQFPPLRCRLMAALLGIIPGGDFHSFGSSKLRVDRNCRNFEGQCRLAPYIRSYEESDIRCVITTVSNFFVSEPLYTKLCCHLVECLFFQCTFLIDSDLLCSGIICKEVAKLWNSYWSFWALKFRGIAPKIVLDFVTYLKCINFGGHSPIDPKDTIKFTLNFWQILDLCPPKFLGRCVVGWTCGKVSLPSSYDKILLGELPSDPEVRSFETFYIGWVKTTVNNFLLLLD